MGVGKSGDGEWMGVKGDWKMGMISDYDELQKNQAQNDPLTVKTPPPPARAPLLPGGCRAAGYAAGVMSPAVPAPAPAPAPAGVAPGVRSPTSLAHQRLRANAEKVQIPALTEGQTGQVVQAANVGQGVPLVHASLLPFLPF